VRKKLLQNSIFASHPIGKRVELGHVLMNLGLGDGACCCKTEKIFGDKFKTKAICKDLGKM
jgi:hypothetical protein